MQANLHSYVLTPSNRRRDPFLSFVSSTILSENLSNLQNRATIFKCKHNYVCTCTIGILHPCWWILGTSCTAGELLHSFCGRGHIYVCGMYLPQVTYGILRICCIVFMMWLSVDVCEHSTKPSQGRLKVSSIAAECLSGPCRNTANDFSCKLSKLSTYVCSCKYELRIYLQRSALSLFSSAIHSVIHLCLVVEHS